MCVWFFFFFFFFFCMHTEMTLKNNTCTHKIDSDNSPLSACPVQDLSVMLFFIYFDV